MTKDNKPDANEREFWLPLSTLIVNSDQDRPEGIHVIEYAAYAALKLENEKLEGERDDFARMVDRYTLSTVRDLSARLALAVSALEQIAELTIWNNQSLEQDFHDANEKARTTLAKIKGGE